MPPFIITLRNEKEKLYHKLAGLIFIFNGALIAYSLVSQKLNRTQISIAIASLTLVLITLFISLAIPKHSRREYFSLLAYFTSGIFWTYQGYWWISLIMLALVMLYYIAKRILRVSILENEIIYPTWPERKISWKELNNIILKDSILTIDFKNNKIIQQSVDEQKTTVNEKEFNEFCKQQLSK